MTQDQREINRKLRVLEYAKEIVTVSKACRFYGLSRQGFYKWKRAYDRLGEAGLIRTKPGPTPGKCKLRTPPEIEEKILYIRLNYHLGPLRISWYLKRYHGIQISAGGVRNVLIRQSLNRLPRNQKKRALKTI